MGVFTIFDGWISQNIQQRLKAEPTRSENVKPSSVSKKSLIIEPPFYWDPSASPKEKAESMEQLDQFKSMPILSTDPKYFDLNEVARQLRLWNATNKQHPWYDAPAKVKVKTKNGLCHLNIEFTLGWPPQQAYEMFNDPRNMSFFKEMGMPFRTRLDTKFTKVLKKDGPRQISEVEKVYRWKLLGYSGFIPMKLTMDENHQKLTGKYKKKKLKYMKVFEGSWKIEPLYVDQERLCKSRSRISDEQYKKCSGGNGRIGSKVTMEHIFQPSSLLNVPPVSWLVRGITIKATKALLEDLRKYVIDMNKVEVGKWTDVN